MVIGNGMLANRFGEYRNNEKKIIFASGVSNSGNTKEEDFQRELMLLNQVIDNNNDKSIIYFSTCSIGDPDLKFSPYVLHKIAMENIIRRMAKSFYIFRISNIVGVSNNPYTLLNNFIFNILQNQPLTIWKNAYRNVIDIDDVYIIVNHVLQNNLFLNKTVNIANTINYSVQFIVKTIEKYLNKKADYIEIDRGSNYRIDIADIKPIVDQYNIRFDNEYFLLLLKKYYHSK